jgi:hypothetical protein
MQNAARFKDLGIPGLVKAVGNKRVMPDRVATVDPRKDRDCDPHYSPDLDEPIDGDWLDTNSSKMLILSLLLCFSCA